MGDLSALLTRAYRARHHPISPLHPRSRLPAQERFDRVDRYIVEAASSVLLHRLLEANVPFRK